MGGGGTRVVSPGWCIGERGGYPNIRAKVVLTTASKVACSS